jgi:hypothetical protein
METQLYNVFAVTHAGGGGITLVKISCCHECTVTTIKLLKLRDASRVLKPVSVGFGACPACEGE